MFQRFQRLHVSAGILNQCSTDTNVMWIGVHGSFKAHIISPRFLFPMDDICIARRVNGTSSHLKWHRKFKWQRENLTKSQIHFHFRHSKLQMIFTWFMRFDWKKSIFYVIEGFVVTFNGFVSAAKMLRENKKRKNGIALINC